MATILVNCCSTLRAHNLSSIKHSRDIARVPYSRSQASFLSSNARSVSSRFSTMSGAPSLTVKHDVTRAAGTRRSSPIVIGPTPDETAPFFCCRSSLPSGTRGRSRRRHVVFAHGGNKQLFVFCLSRHEVPDCVPLALTKEAQHRESNST